MPQVFDSLGQQYDLEESPIGEGGQGAVYRVQGQPRRIVKLMSRARDPEALRGHFAALRRMSLQDLHVARPISVLKAPDVGYVAEFLDGMSPILSLMRPPQGRELLPWYIETGGLRRRLRLLAHAGEALAGLHTRGLIYMDISPNNIFVSSAPHALEAWLIDLDNLCYTSELGKSFFTPFFGAPEVVKGREGCTSLSDAWAFAVLVWNTLTLNHPLIGDHVNDGEPELEEQALRGELPWVAHSSNDLNLSTTGLPHELVVSRRLLALARRAFEEGVEEPLRRPSVSEWVSELHAAADQTRACAACGSTALANAPDCPWCGAPWAVRAAQVKIRRWHPEHGLISELGHCGALCLSDEPLTLIRRVTHALVGVSGREAHALLERAPRGVRVTPKGTAGLWYAKVQGDDPQRPAHTRSAVAHAPRPVSPDGVTLPWNQYILLFEHPSREQRAAELIGGDA